MNRNDIGSRSDRQAWECRWQTPDSRGVTHLVRLPWGGEADGFDWFAGASPWSMMTLLSQRVMQASPGLWSWSFGSSDDLRGASLTLGERCHPLQLCTPTGPRCEGFRRVHVYKVANTIPAPSPPQWDPLRMPRRLWGSGGNTLKIASWKSFTALSEGVDDSNGRSVERWPGDAPSNCRMELNTRWMRWRESPDR